MQRCHLSVSQSVEQLARQSGELLIRQLKKYLKPFEPEWLQSKFIIRDSADPVNK